MKWSEVKCGDVKCNEVVEHLKGVKPNGRKVIWNRVKLNGNEVSISAVKWSKGLGEQGVLYLLQGIYIILG